jgi:DNA-directed RNA polymerase specialized sigma24 family protein
MKTSDADPITGWIVEVKDGDEEAAAKFHRKYGPAVVAYVKKRLDVRLPEADEEDIAQEAFKSFFSNVREERFFDLSNRNKIWAFLITLAFRKLCRRVKRERRQKRGEGIVRGESAFVGKGEGSAFGGIGDVPDAVATLGNEVIDTREGLLNLLDRKRPDGVLRKVAVLREEGYSDAEIGQRIGRSQKSVERYLRTVRQIWTEAGFGES